MKIKKKLSNFTNLKDKFLVGLLVITVLLITGLFVKNQSFILGVRTQQSPIPTIDDTSTSTSESPTPTAIPVQKNTYVDPDPAISCNINVNCGGGTTSLKKSECSNSTCCQIGNKWIFYKDKNQCSKDQGQNVPSSNRDYVPSSNTYPTYTNPSINCVVSYPCTGNSYTYQVDQSTCSFMQSGAASTCSTADAIKKMQDIVNQPIVLPTIPPADYTIHMDPTPTPGVPYGFSN